MYCVDSASEGFFWFECKEVWIEGLKSYFLDLWNILDMMVLSMYLASFTLRVLIMLRGFFLCDDPSTQELCDYFTNSSEINIKLFILSGNISLIVCDALKIGNENCVYLLCVYST